MTDSINGFELVKPFSNEGGGQSRWTFARRGGVEYFIKEFLSPKYPVPEAPGSPETKRRMAERCEVFESHHSELTTALADIGGSGGNLVVTKFFFRHGPKYYRLTDKVDVSSLSTDGIAALPRERQIRIALAVTHSLSILHQQGIVHGDLKPPNVLINDVPSTGYSTKLIDFDNAFFAGRPPIVDDLVGDPAYLSPELLAYINEEGPAEQVGLASDIFALGILFLAYFSADVRRTEEDGRLLYPAEVVARGASLTSELAESWPAASELVARMVRREPAERPNAKDVHGTLKKLRVDPGYVDAAIPAVSPATPTTQPEPPEFSGTSRVKRKEPPAAAPPTSRPPAAPPFGGTSRIKRKDSGHEEPAAGPGTSRLRGKTIAVLRPEEEGEAAPPADAEPTLDGTEIPRPRLRGRVRSEPPPSEE